MKKKSIVISLLLAIIVPFAGAYADDPIIPITTLEEFTTYGAAAGNFRLDADIVLTGNTYVRNGFNLDLNGHTISGNGNVLVDSGDVTIKDTSSAQTGKITSKTKQTVQVSNGTLTFESGTIENTNSYGVVVTATGTFHIKGGKISAYSYAVYSSGGGIILDSGTIETTGNYYAVSLSKPNAKFTMNGGTVIAEHAPTGSESAGSGGVGIAAFKDTEVIINGGSVSSHSCALMSNGSVSGSSEGTNAKFTITGGTLTSRATAIYNPQPNGVTNISGGTIKGGNVAMEIRAGTVNITGGTFIGGAGDQFTSTPNYSGTTAKNAAVVVAQHNTKLPTKVTISGGTFNAEVPFVENNPQGNGADDINKVEIKITSEEGKPFPEFNASGDYTILSEDFEGFVYAGRYTHDIPDEYVAEDHGEIIESDTKDVVYPYRKAKAEPTENGTVGVSVERTLRGIEVTLNPQPDPGYEVISIDVTDDEGNHIPVVNNKYIAPNLNTTVVVKFGAVNPSTLDNILDYGSFMGLCGVGLVFAISGIRLARTLRRVI